MTKLLYINAHPGDPKDSKSQLVAGEFLQTYLLQHPDTQVTHLNLWSLDAPDIDPLVYSAFTSLMNGISPENLTPEQQEALAKRQTVIDQFIAHDRYIFVAPMWEFSFPSVLKKYLDIICALRQTFKYNEFGLPEGLLKNKQAIFVQASGGNYTQESQNQFRKVLSTRQDADKLLATFDNLGNFGEKIVRATLAIIGINNYQHLIIPMQSNPEYASIEFNGAITRAKQLATIW